MMAAPNSHDNLESSPLLLELVDSAEGSGKAKSLSAALADTSDVGDAESPATTLTDNLDDDLDTHYQIILARFKRSIFMEDFNDDLLTSGHLVSIKQFLTSHTPARLVIYTKLIEGVSVLVVTSQFSSSAPSDLYYFIRQTGDPLTVKNYGRIVQFGKISKNLAASMLSAMTSIYVPLFRENQSWPDNASITDISHKMDGKTVLYIPEGYKPEFEKIEHSKATVGIFETLLVYWTKQIKDEINSQTSSESHANSGPLAEIKYWKARCIKLSSIRAQIKQPEVHCIVQVLMRSKSSSLEQFQSISKLILKETEEAQDNHKYLSILTNGCQSLCIAEPKTIITLLPPMLRGVRLIWEHSKYYNTSVKLTSLLRKMSSEIIERCTAKIDLDKIFDGDIEQCVVFIQDAIKCGESWKLVYKNCCQNIMSSNQKKWDFDQNIIFAELDAFVGRCRDLIDVCECRLQFSRKSKDAIPANVLVFGGSRGTEINSFHQHITQLWIIREHIMDVKAIGWLEHYNIFKEAIKDLELELSSLIHSAFDDTLVVERCVDLLDTFHHMANREATKRMVEQITADVYQLFLNELNLVRADFESNRKAPQILRSQPYFAGSAFWARALLLRISSPMNSLKTAYFIQSTSFSVEVVKEFDAVSLLLEDYIVKIHADWKASIPENLEEKLDDVLLIRRGDYLQIKFDKDLLRLFAEIHYFNKLKLEIPVRVLDIYSKKEELRAMRENVLLIVREYNLIIQTLTIQEHLLFQERLKFIDRKINIGLTTLKWISKDMTIYFIKECRRHLNDARNIVDQFQACNAQIQEQCNTISLTSLLLLESKRTYDISNFEFLQIGHQEIVRKQFELTHQNLLISLIGIFDFFKNDGVKVIAYWVKYIESIDMKIEKALLSAARNSLLQILKAVNWQDKTKEGILEVYPLIKVDVVMDSQKIEFIPTFLSLQDSISKISRGMMDNIAVIPRLTQRLAPDADLSIPDFYSIIVSENDVMKILNNIQIAISSNTVKCQTYLRNWDSYREIWEINKDGFIRRYAKLKPALSTFDADINRYIEIANNAQKEETMTNVNFIRLDCSPLKHSIVQHCDAWQSKLTTLLAQNAANEVNGLLEMFSSTTQKINSANENPEKIGAHAMLLKSVHNDRTKVETQFGLVHEMYRILETYEVHIKEEDSLKLDSLRGVWVRFQETVVDSETRLENARG